MSRFRSTIAGELSDAEMQIDEEISQYLDAPKFTPSNPGSAMGYALLREDLKSRSMINNELAQRRDLAFGQSARKHMSDQVQKEEANAERTKFAISNVQKMVTEDGMGEKEAMAAYMRKHPEDATIPGVIQTFKDWQGFAEDDFDIYMREQGQQVAKDTIIANGFSAKESIAMNKFTLENIDAQQEIMLKGIEEGKIMGDVKVVNARFEKVRSELQFQRSTQTLDLYNQLQAAGGAEGIDQGSVHRMNGNLQKNGIFIDDLPTIAQNSGIDKYGVMFLGHAGALDGLAARLAGPGATADSVARKKVEVANIINSIDREDYEIAKGEGPEATDAQNRIRDFNRIMRQGTAMFVDANRQAIESMEIRDKVGELSSGLTDQFDKLNNDLTKMFSSDKMGLNTVKNAHRKVMNFTENAIRDAGLKTDSDFKTDKEKIDAIKSVNPNYIDAGKSTKDLNNDGERFGIWVNTARPPAAPWLNPNYFVEGKSDTAEAVKGLAKVSDDYLNDANDYLRRVTDSIVRVKTIRMHGQSKLQFQAGEDGRVTRPPLESTQNVPDTAPAPVQTQPAPTAQTQDQSAPNQGTQTDAGDPFESLLGPKQ